MQLTQRSNQKFGSLILCCRGPFFLAKIYAPFDILCTICRIYTCEIILKTKSQVDLNVQFRVLIWLNFEEKLPCNGATDERQVVGTKTIKIRKIKLTIIISSVALLSCPRKPGQKIVGIDVEEMLGNMGGGGVAFREFRSIYQ